MTSCYNQNANSMMFVDFDSYEKEYIELGKKSGGTRIQLIKNGCLIIRIIFIKRTKLKI